MNDISGSVTILAGDTSATVSVAVNGDMDFEADEGFSLILTGATGATIADNEGAATILNDDSPPPLAGGAFINEIHYDNAEHRRRRDDRDRRRRRHQPHRLAARPLQRQQRSRRGHLTIFAA